MKHPQTLAEQIYQQFPTMKLKSIKDYACCAFTLMWTLHVEPDDAEAILTVGRMMDKGAIDVDCTVYWDKAARFLTGKGAAVQFIDITDPKELKKIKDRTPVKFSYNGKSHWVGVENGRVKFNALEKSLCVEKGKPVTMRIIKTDGGTK
ncbi:MAG: hypothetical protein IIZ93_08795 [Acidaminococcaceae bacterium]|nr:hypothetical protein [Acidaminococcaceae bacterium]